MYVFCVPWVILSASILTLVAQHHQRGEGDKVQQYYVSKVFISYLRQAKPRPVISSKTSSRQATCSPSSSIKAES